MYGLFYSALAGGKNMFTPNVFGTGGAFVDGKVNDEPVFENPVMGMMMKGVPVQHMKLHEPHVYGDVMELIDCVREGNDRPCASAEHGRHVLEIIEAGFESMRTGKTVELKTTFTPLSLEELD